MRKNNILTYKFSLITSIMVALAVLYFAGGMMGIGVLDSLKGNMSFYQYNNIVLFAGLLISYYFYLANEESIDKIDLSKFLMSYSLIMYLNFLVFL